MWSKHDYRPLELANHIVVSTGGGAPFCPRWLPGHGSSIARARVVSSPPSLGTAGPGHWGAVWSAALRNGTMTLHHGIVRTTFTR